MKNMINIDLSLGSVMQGNALQQALAQGQDPQAMLQQIASNSLRPYIDPEDPFKQYCTVMTGNNEDGSPKFEAVPMGNAATTTLLRGEWEKIDGVVRGVAVGQMNILNMLVSAGLTIPLDGMGVTKFTWQRMGQMGEARLDMDMTSTTNNDKMEFDEQSIPIPIISSGWDINMRYLAQTRKMGMSIDTVYARNAAYKVAQFAEYMMVNGAGTFKANGGQIYGLRNTPVALTGTLATDWDDSGVTGEEIVDEVASWVRILKGKHHYGPYSLIIPQRWSYKLSKDYKAESDKSILARIKELEGIGNVVFSESLNDDATTPTTHWSNEAYLLELNTDTVAILDGMPLTNFQWQIKGPITVEHKIAMIRVPLFRNDIESQSGLLKATKAGTAKA